MRRFALVSTFALWAAACTPPHQIPTVAARQDAHPDSLGALIARLPTQQSRTLSAAHWRLLRAQEARACSLFQDAQVDLDQALHVLATAAADGAVDSTCAQLGSAVEDEYLRLLPHLQHFSPDSPLVLLLQGLSDEKIESLSADATQLVRLHQVSQQCDIPVDANAKVAASIHFFQTRGRATLQTWMRRSGRFRAMIQQILREEQVPEDLLYVAMVESGFNTKAYSHARAVGLWQFIAHTGRLQGLRRTHWVDERRDPFKSTRAAARHLRDLYRSLNDWRLAIAAYNCGRGRVQRAMQRAASRDFWELDLPRETENYVPLIMAAAVIGHDPQRFDFTLPKPDAPFAYDTVRLPRDIPYIDLRVAAKVLHVSYAELRYLNPELRQRITPPGKGGRGYRLRLPRGKGPGFLKRYAALPGSAKPALYEYVVQPSDNLSSIATAFGIRSRLIAEANSITNPNRIFPGQRLFIPAGDGVRVTAAHEKVNHAVRPGESLSLIAQQNRVRVRDLIAWNGLTTTTIHPGDQLVVWRRQAQVHPKRAAGTARPGTQGTHVHTVAAGETLWELSRRFDVSVSQLREWNQLRTDLIRPGQKLVVKPGDDAEGATSGQRLYKVVRGDTLYSIAERFGLRVKDLARQNNMSLSSALLAGTTLRIFPAADTD